MENEEKSRSIVKIIVFVVAILIGVAIVLAAIKFMGKSDGGEGVVNISPTQSVQVTKEPEPTDSVGGQDKVNEMIGTGTELEVPEADVSKYVSIVNVVSNLMYNGFNCEDKQSAIYGTLEEALTTDCFEGLIDEFSNSMRAYDNELIDITEDVKRIRSEKEEEDTRLELYEDMTYESWYKQKEDEATAQYNRLNPVIDPYQPWQRYVGMEITDENGNVLYGGTKSLDELTEEEVEIIKKKFSEDVEYTPVIETDEQYYYYYGVYPGETTEDDFSETMEEWFGNYDGIDWTWLEYTEDSWNREFKLSHYTDELDERITVDGDNYYFDTNNAASNTEFVSLLVYGSYVNIDLSEVTYDYTAAAGDSRYIAVVNSYEFWYGENAGVIECYGAVSVTVGDNLYNANVRVSTDGKISIDSGFITDMCSVKYDSSSYFGGE